jgi:hypothetical protein
LKIGNKFAYLNVTGARGHEKQAIFLSIIFDFCRYFSAQYPFIAGPDEHAGHVGDGEFGGISVMNGTFQLDHVRHHRIRGSDHNLWTPARVQRRLRQPSGCILGFSASAVGRQHRIAYADDASALIGAFSDIYFTAGENEKYMNKIGGAHEKARCRVELSPEVIHSFVLAPVSFREANYLSLFKGFHG